jgi:hypothetical protein
MDKSTNRGASAALRSPDPSTAPPQTVSELRVAVLAADPHLARVRLACRALDLGEHDSETRSGPDPHLALIESSGLRQRSDGSGPLSEEKAERAVELVGWCEGRGIPSILWETSPRREIATPRSLLRSADHLFVADPDAVARLGERLGRAPMQLPLAVQSFPEDSPALGERDHAVGFLARWPSKFSGRLRGELDEILAAAEGHGLIIFQPEQEGDETGLSEHLRALVTPVRSAEEAIASFRNCRVVVAFDPCNRSRMMVPQLAFEALGSGSATLIPNHPGTRRLLRHAAAVATTRGQADAALETLLRDEKEWITASRLGRRVIQHAHTYSHRLATVASAAGFRVVPARDGGVLP